MNINTPVRKNNGNYWILKRVEYKIKKRKPHVLPLPDTDISNTVGNQPNIVLEYKVNQELSAAGTIGGQPGYRYISYLILLLLICQVTISHYIWIILSHFIRRRLHIVLGCTGKK